MPLRTRRDLDGLRFGHLVVEEFAGTKWSQAAWRCRCDCGSDKVVAGYQLSSGRTRSCGCLKIERTKEIKTTHGHTRGRKPSTEYVSWSSAKDRCHNPGDHNYADYGGRGITVCDRWESFENFLADMGPKPSPKHTLERTDNDKGYEPGNCRWATRKEQARNFRRNRLVEIAGEQMSLAEAAERFGVPYSRLAWRQRLGWPIEEAISAPRQTKWSRSKRT